MAMVQPGLIPEIKENNLVLWYLSDFAGCGYLRSIFPNDILNSSYGRKEQYAGVASNYFITDKNVFSKAKAIHFQRQITPQQVQFIELFRKLRDDNPTILKYKIIYDLDDLYTEIPPYNYCWDKFIKQDVLDGFEKIKHYVDIFTTSTYFLKKKIMELGPGACKMEVMPNYIPRYIYGGNVIKTKNEKPRIAWAGSETHFNWVDMGDFKPIYDLVKNTWQEFDWMFLGIRKFQGWMEEFQGKVKNVPWTSLFDFPRKLKDINADFGVAPLIDNNFNRAKSNIKCLDYWSADIIPICSNLNPYSETADLFFSGDWKVDRDMIWDIFNSTEKTESIIKRQKRKLEKYWLENHMEDYLELFDFKKVGLNIENKGGI